MSHCSHFANSLLIVTKTLTTSLQPFEIIETQLFFHYSLSLSLPLTQSTNLNITQTNKCIICMKYLVCDIYHIGEALLYYI